MRLSIEGGPAALDAWLAGPATRLFGLAGLPRLPPGRALLIPRCAAVHTLGMRFPIDAALLRWPPTGGVCEAIAVRESVPPARLVGAPWRGARGAAVLEAGEGTLAALGIEPGVRLGIKPG